MKIIGIIAEYNPCHNGHLYMLQEAKKRAGADAAVVILSGNYVQRGEPAILDKYARTAHALQIGADLVLELPTAAACGSAQRFAEGAVAALNAAGCIDELWFGSETGEISLMARLAAILSEEPDPYRMRIRANLAAGLSFAAAREKAVLEALSELIPDVTVSSDEISSLLHNPNNTLGLEYLCAIKKSGSRIIPRTIKRAGEHYHSLLLPGDGNTQCFCSASAVRKALQKANPSINAASVFSGGFLPDAVAKDLLSACSKDVQGLLFPDDFSSMLLYKLLSEDCRSLCRYLDVPSALADRICSMLPEFTTFSGFAEMLSTRNFPVSTSRRALLHILLGITERDLKEALHPAYLRVLGFRKSSAEIFSVLKQTCNLPLITKASALPENTIAPLFADRLYEAALAQKSGRPARHPFTRQIVRL